MKNHQLKLESFQHFLIVIGNVDSIQGFSQDEAFDLSFCTEVDIHFQFHFVRYGVAKWDCFTAETIFIFSAIDNSTFLSVQFLL